MTKRTYATDLVAEARKVADVLILFPHHAVDKVRNDLAFVVIPAESAQDRSVRQALLQKTPKVGLVPIDRAQGLLNATVAADDSLFAIYTLCRTRIAIIWDARGETKDPKELVRVVGYEIIQVVAVHDVRRVTG